ncbi:hypothetical protein BC829DRAFT_419475 [Chytridium lagenaria]|nr:hypothetical protein BC829DRAFT_419475 [Chytridium lagenaria]
MGKKQLRQQALDACPRPLEENRYVGRVVEIRGGGLYEVMTAYLVEGGIDGEKTYEERNELVRLPSKFRNAVWIKRGSFAIIQYLTSKTKVSGEIVHVLRPEHIKELKSEGLWPAILDQAANAAEAARREVEDEGEGSDDDGLFVNRNRMGAESGGESSGEEEGEEEAVVEEGVVVDTTEQKVE